MLFHVCQLPIGISAGRQLYVPVALNGSYIVHQIHPHHRFHGQPSTFIHRWDLNTMLLTKLHITKPD